jgi:hypothetical protein
MNQSYFVTTLIAALTLVVLSINVGITFAQEKKIKHQNVIILL